MGLFDEEALPNGKRVNPIPVVQEYQTARVSTEDIAVGTLMTHIGGARFILPKFYSQVLGKDEEVSARQSGLAPINRQHRVIYNLEIKVTSMPSTTIDDKNQEGTRRGTAIAYPNSVVPNPGDMFIADGPDGRKVFWQVCDRVAPKEIFKRTAYEFDYIQKDWWNQEEETRLDQSVIAEYYFIRDNIDAGINPLIAKKDYGTWEKLSRLQEIFPRNYIMRFMSREYNTFVIPGQPTTIYDPFHTSFCDAIFGNENTGYRGGFTVIPTEDGSNANRLSVHSALLMLDPGMMNFVLNSIPIVTVKAMIEEPYLGGVRWAGTRFVVWPPEDTGMLMYPSSYPAPPSYTLTTNVFPGTRVPLTLEKAFASEDLGAPIADPWLFKDADIRRVTMDKYYIFSQAFYGHDDANMSKLERMVWDSMETNMVNPTELLRLFDESEKWPVLEQFYYLPFLYALIPSAQRGV